jgi:DNA-binding beta-propeller fold protein YncE
MGTLTAHGPVSICRRLVKAGVLVGVTLAAISAHAAAQSSKNKPKDRNGAAAPVLVWPLPPEAPRVRYLSAYYGSTDFATKKPGRWKTALLGNTVDLTPADLFVKPYAVAVSPDGRIYASDTAARRVFVIDPDRQTLTFIGERGSASFSKPVGIAIDGAGTVFVADATLKRVLTFDAGGAFIGAIGNENDLGSPAGVAVDRTRQLLYVVDSGRHQVVVYSLPDGARVRTIGTRGGEDGEFNFPTNVCVDAAGRVYVADTLNFRVQVFDAAGAFVRHFGTLGDAPGTFNRPKGIAVDSEGHIYVSDTAFANVQIFDATGELLLFVGHGGSGPGEFFLPAGLYIDERDRLFVADQGNSRLQVFQYLSARAR